MIRLTLAPRVLALLLLGATISSGVLAAPTTSSMNSSPLSQALQSCSPLPEQDSLLDVQRPGAIEYVNLVHRAEERAQALERLRTLGLAYSRLADAREHLRDYAYEHAQARAEMSQNHDHPGDDHELSATVPPDTQRLYDDKSFLLRLEHASADGRRVNTPAQRQALFLRNQNKLRHIISRAEAAVNSASPSLSLIELASENHRNCLTYFPSGYEKNAAGQRMHAHIAMWHSTTRQM
ncbi:hypothetical protein FB446DRAFT_725207 [Lentinula raphanica]|nr:hypothetical protein FB446DRAFT_725207 [Lentinula raphanica]